MRSLRIDNNLMAYYHIKGIIGCMNWSLFTACESVLILPLWWLLAHWLLSIWMGSWCMFNAWVHVLYSKECSRNRCSLVHGSPISLSRLPSSRESLCILWGVAREKHVSDLYSVHTSEIMTGAARAAIQISLVSIERSIIDFFFLPEDEWRKWSQEIIGKWSQEIQ